MSDHRRQQTEQDRHRRAFEVYYAQGGNRSHDRVARELGVSLATVKVWSRSFSWQRRVDERDARLAREIADRTHQEDSIENERHLKIVRGALLRLAKGIAEGKIRMQLSDVDRMIRLERQLSGADQEKPGPRYNPVHIYIPDNGRGRIRPPVIVLPDNGRDPRNTTEGDAESDGSTPPS